MRRITHLHSDTLDDDLRVAVDGKRIRTIRQKLLRHASRDVEFDRGK
jgi:hypothetical protein